MDPAQQEAAPAMAPVAAPVPNGEHANQPLAEPPAGELPVTMELPIAPSIDPAAQAQGISAGMNQLDLPLFHLTVSKHLLFHSYFSLHAEKDHPY